ncbi:zinc finger, CCHC-type containing protein [Tanacetum coccineum]
MKATNMPQNFWAEAVRHAIYILNSVPTKALEDITPYEAIKHRKPNLENLRVFGCIAYAKIPSQHLTKLDDKSTKMVYLGNEQGSKDFRLFDPTTQRIRADGIPLNIRLYQVVLLEALSDIDKSSIIVNEVDEDVRIY